MHKRILPMIMVLLTVTACGGGSVSSSLAHKYFSGENVQAPEAANPTPEEINPAPYVDVAENNISYATVPESETSHILTTVNFRFDTAKLVRLQVDIAKAAGTQSSLSICTDYEAIDDGYSVNYNSCSIKAQMLNGQFEHPLEIMNQYDSAVAVIWFPNQEFDPMYNELNVADLIKSGDAYVWNWK